ncbi:MAG: sigma-70 family RNA polymerase sigma factor [Clostridia bacterium]|nr:sigma-70 family RNA polymerase sigma factor [Clostridia bacterium]
MQNEEFTRAIVAMTDTLYRVAATQLRQKADREDAVQECLRRAWEKRHSLRDERYLQTWVIRILLNECHNMQRKMARTLPREDIPAVQPQREETGLKEALLQLEERYRMPILLHYMEGYSVKEVAGMLRVPQGTVKTWLSRGRKALEAILNEEVFEG